MSKTIFIADLHLDKHYPNAVAAFLVFLKQLEKESVDALYILGDLFDYWVGDDCVDKTAQTVADALSYYARSSNTPLYFIHGNRDFLLGEDFAQQCQLQILAEHTVINLYGEETLILHGDTLCTDDVAYMQFREQVRDPNWQANTLRLPAWLRRLKAKQLRRRSKKANQEKSTAIMDVAQDSVEALIRQHAVTCLIHGHTHRPNIHQFTVDGKAIKRCVVGDWYTQGSVLIVTPDNIELTVLPFSINT